MSALPTQAEWDKIVADFKSYETRVNTSAAKPPTPPAPKPAPKPVVKPAPVVAPKHLFLVDVSSFNNPDFRALKRAGVAGVWSQVTDGQGFADGNFWRNYEASRQHGVKFAAYHFLRSTSSIDAQLANIAKHIGNKNITVSIDCEPAGASRPTLAHVREFIAKAPRYGIKVGYLYLPHFYWEQLGRPSLKGLPPLWQASYGANPVGSPSTVYAKAGGDRGAGWATQGGVVPKIWQFGSQIVIPGYSGHLDCDVVRGFVPSIFI